MPFHDRLRRLISTVLFSSVVAVLCLCAACAYDRNLTEGDNPGDLDGAGSGTGVRPQSMSRFAYERIVISGLPFAASTTAEIIVGGLACVDVAIESDYAVSCMVLPNCGSGPQEIILRSGADEVIISDAFEFEASGEPLMGGLLAIGGGWMAGARNGALYPAAQLTSIAAYVARQSHSCMPLPLATAAGFPAIKDLADLDRSIGRLSDAEIDAALEPFMSGAESIAARRQTAGANALIAVPYISAGDETDGVALGSRAAVFERFVRGDTGNEESLVDEIIRRKPEFIISDFEPFIYSAHTGHFEDLQLRRDDIEAHIGRFFDALAALEEPPYLFMLNAPPLNIFPALEYSERARYESIWINDALYRNAVGANEALQKKGLDKRFFVVDLYSLLYEVAATRGRVTLSGLDLPTLIESNGESDLIVTDGKRRHQQVGFDLLEGFFSLDAYHPTAAASALVANLMLESINAELGPQSARRLLNAGIELVDIATVLTDDPLSPHNVQQAAAELDLLPLEEYQDESGLPELHRAHYCAIRWGGNMPDYSICPAKISFVSEDDAIVAAADENIGVRVFLKTGSREKAGWPVMAYSSGKGHFIGDLAVTSAQGFADFVYRTASSVGNDKLVFYSGDASGECELTVTPAKEGQ